MKYCLIITLIISAFVGSKSFAQEKIKNTPEKIVTKDKEHNIKTIEKNNEFVAISDSVKIKDRHGRKKTKDYSAHTVIKEKNDKMKFKDKKDGSWMKEKKGVIRSSKNYDPKNAKDSI